MAILIVGVFQNQPIRILNQIRKTRKKTLYARTCQRAGKVLESAPSISAIAIESNLPRREIVALITKIKRSDKVKKVPIFFLAKAASKPVQQPIASTARKIVSTCRARLRKKLRPVATLKLAHRGEESDPPSACSFPYY